LSCCKTREKLPNTAREACQFFQVIPHGFILLSRFFN
jgi:hypothetical protein